MQLHILFAIIVFFCGCATKDAILDSKIDDLSLSQRAVMYISDNKEILDRDFSLKLKQEYLDKYFSVWDKNFIPPNKEDVFWGLSSKRGFGESKRYHNDRFLDELRLNADVSSYPSRDEYAIMTKTTNVRVLPTIKPRFSKQDGYPFDRWQNSLIFAWTPIRILHEDKTKEWVLIQSAFVSGWVKFDEVAKMSKKDMQNLMNAKNFVVPTRDRVPLYHDDKFVVQARIGMLFQKINDKIYGYYRNNDGLAVKIPLSFEANLFSDFPLAFNQSNIANIADSLNLENYGWGGMYENRDCSAFIRDVLMNVGIFLPRNSLAQVNAAKSSPYSTYIALPKDNDKKIDLIRQTALPFRTIFWLKGHIMLYIGEYNNEPIVMHDVWAVRSSKGVNILGGISITTLIPGNEQNGINPPSSLLDRIEAMSIIVK